MFTENQLNALKQAGKIRGYTDSHPKRDSGSKGTQNASTAKRGNKYGAVKCEVDGITFDSTKEANRYKELKMLLKAGHIAYLERQVPYELNEGGTHSLKYLADFVYVDALTGKTVVEDTKGFKTASYKKKRRLMKKLFGITIYET